MSNGQTQTGMERRRHGGLMGPVVLITIGVLFLMDRFWNYGFHQLWPVLLIVIGLVKLFGSMRARNEGSSS